MHRLLYLNYIGDVKKNEYLKYTCPNKGKCCNINHIIKINSKKTLELEDSSCKSSIEEKDTIDKSDTNDKPAINDKSKIITKNSIESNINIISDNKDKLIIIF